MIKCVFFFFLGFNINVVSIGISVRVRISELVMVKLMLNVIGLNILFFSFCRLNSGRNIMMMIRIVKVIGLVILWVVVSMVEVWFIGLLWVLCLVMMW